MKYVIYLFVLVSISACAKKKDDSVAAEPPLVVMNMECTTPDGHYRYCATPDGATQTKPAECSTSFNPGPGSSGYPLSATGRVITGNEAVDDAWDCGIRSGKRCIFIEFHNGWQDLRCDDYQLP